MTEHVSKELTEAQAELVRHTTRGNRKDGVSRGEQLHAARTDQQAWTRRPARCICCLGPRDPRSHPVCDTCRSTGRSRGRSQ